MTFFSLPSYISRAVLLPGILFFSFKVLWIKIHKSSQLTYLIPDMSNITTCVWMHKSKREKLTQGKNQGLLHQECNRLKKKRLESHYFYSKTNFQLIICKAFAQYISIHYSLNMYSYSWNLWSCSSLIHFQSV